MCHHKRSFIYKIIIMFKCHIHSNYDILLCYYYYYVGVFWPSYRPWLFCYIGGWRVLRDEVRWLIKSSYVGDTRLSAGTSVVLFLDRYAPPARAIYIHSLYYIICADSLALENLFLRFLGSRLLYTHIQHITRDAPYLRHGAYLTCLPLSRALN